MSKIFSAMKLGLYSDEYKEFLLYTGSIAFYWVLIFYALGWDWISQAKGMIDCFKVMCVFSYIKSCDNAYKSLNDY